MKDKKLKKLEKILKELGSVVVAYSGGVDSTFLAKVAVSLLGKRNALAVTAKSETYPSSENEQAKICAKKLGLPHKVIYTKELDVKNFKKNPTNRCYFCKKELFGKLKKIAAQRRLKNVIDGSNIDDVSDWRPGSQAAKELKVISPLREAGLTKGDIRALSRRMRLPTWDKPSFACLASRIPYNSTINKAKLKMVDAAEEFLKDLKFRQVRVRCYDKLARIEVDPAELVKIIGLRKKIIKKFIEIGFRYITVDLEGYRTGSMNEGVGHVQDRRRNKVLELS